MESWETEILREQLQRNRVATVTGKGRFLDANHIEIFNEADPEYDTTTFHCL